MIDKNIVFEGVESYFTGTVRLLYNGDVGHSYSALSLKSRHKNYLPVISATVTPWDYISAYCTRYIKAGESVYVEPKARIARDILRNSGYKITIDRSKANVIVIPELMQEQTDYWTCSLVAYEPNTHSLYMFSVRDKRKYSDAEIKLFTDKIQSVYGSEQTPMQFYYKDNYLTRICVNFIPPVQSYIEVLTNFESTQNYIVDSAVNFVPNYNICIDTLELWSHITDSTLLEKCLIGSDWQKYPFTLFTFFSAERGCANVMCSSNKNLCMISDRIHYKYGEFPSKEEISPEDWNLCQKWILHKLGIDDGKGAFIDASQFAKLSHYYTDVIRKKLAVASLEITTPISYANIRSLL